MLKKKYLRLTDAGFLLYSPVSVLAYPVSVLVVNPTKSPISLISIGILITLISWLPYKALETIHNRTKSNSVALVTLYFSMPVALTGAIRGLAFYSANQYFKLIQPSPLSERIISSLFTTLIWLSAANIVINISRGFKSVYQSTLNQFLASQFATATLLSNSDAKELREFQEGLSGSLSELLLESDSASFKKISERLTLHINEELRPLSRRIWLRSLSEYPIINYKILLTDSLKRLSFSQPFFWLIMTSLALLENLFLRNFSESFWRTASYLVATSLVIWIHSIIRKKTMGLGFNLVFLTLVGAIPIYLSEFLAGQLGYATQYFAATLIIPIPIAVIVILSLIELTQQDRAFLLELLKESGKSIYDQTAKGVDLNRRQVASYLHNSFQSELLALSSQLAAAAISENPEKVSAILQKVAAVSSRSLTDDLAKISQDPLSRLQSVIESWKNLLEIEVAIPDDLLHSKLNSVIFIQTVEEIASNAHRHDGATSLVIEADPGEFGTQITFQSNGGNPITTSKGMGETWLNQISLSPWSIEKNAIGTLIKIEI